MKFSKKAVKDKRVHDFVGGMQFYSSIKESFDIIITEDAYKFYSVKFRW